MLCGKGRRLPAELLGCPKQARRERREGVKASPLTAAGAAEQPCSGGQRPFLCKGASRAASLQLPAPLRLVSGKLAAGTCPSGAVGGVLPDGHVDSEENDPWFPVPSCAFR